MQREPFPEGSTALISGGGGGVGVAIARVLRGAGFRPELFGRTLETLLAAAESVGEGVTVATGDVASRSDAERVVQRITQSNGPLRILVNAAGIAESSPLLPPDDALWERTLSTNLTGVWTMSTACLPAMIEAGGGVIINIASTAALRGYRYTAAYVASKHGVLGLTRAMAEDLANKKVDVHAICPGFLATPMTDRTIARLMETTGRDEAGARQIIADMNASGALIQPEAVAKLDLELVQDPTRQSEVIPLE